MSCGAATISCILFVFTCICHHVACDSWSSAVPQSGIAQGGWTITLNGNFNVSKQFKLTLVQSENIASSSAQVSSSFFSPTSQTTLLIVVPSVTFAAGLTNIQITDGAGSSIQGPTGSAQQILILASWSLPTQSALSCTTSCGCGPASGGTKITIDGYGLDTSASDYVCKFWCFNGACLSSTFVQSTVPDPPNSLIQRLVCTTPAWPFNARSLAGRTQITLEKAGYLLPFQSQGCSNIFDYQDGWTGIDAVEGYATAGSTALTITGYGFEAGSQNYSCVFSTAQYTQGGPATVVSPYVLLCAVPLWSTAAARTGLTVYKQSCAGARGAAAACDAASLVPLGAGLAQPVFTFRPAVASIAPATTAAFTAGAATATIAAGGLDSSTYAYVAQFSDGVAAVNVTVSAANATSTSLALQLPIWGTGPNQTVTVTVFESGRALPVSPPAGAARLNFTYMSVWYNLSTAAAAGPVRGPAAGGDQITVSGAGFVVNATVGTGGDYACEFRDVTGNSLRSAPAPALSPAAVVCVAPAWGLRYVATTTTVTLYKGGLAFPPPPGPAPTYAFVRAWDAWSESAGPAGGGATLTISGYGFDTAAVYMCR